MVRRYLNSTVLEIWSALEPASAISLASPCKRPAVFASPGQQSAMLGPASAADAAQAALSTLFSARSKRKPETDSSSAASRGTIFRRPRGTPYREKKGFGP